jgi:hypothetical protein
VAPNPFFSEDTGFPAGSTDDGFDLIKDALSPSKVPSGSAANIYGVPSLNNNDGHIVDAVDRFQVAGDAATYKSVCSEFAEFMASEAAASTGCGDATYETMEHTNDDSDETYTQMEHAAAGDSGSRSDGGKSGFVYSTLGGGKLGDHETYTRMEHAGNGCGAGDSGSRTDGGESGVFYSTLGGGKMGDRCDGMLQPVGNPAADPSSTYDRLSPNGRVDDAFA